MMERFVGLTAARRATLSVVLVALGFAVTARNIAGEEVTVFPLQGPAFSGKLVQLDSTGLEVESSGSTRRYRLEQLRRMDFMGAASAPRVSRPMKITLTDGSLLRGETFSAADSSASVGLSAERVLEIPTRVIAHVALRDYGVDEGLWNRWMELASADYSQDTLIYRREADGVVSLDTLQGVLYDVRAENVDFLYDGERISPRRERIDGLVYFHPPRSVRNPPTLCLIRDRSDSLWQVGKLRLLDGDLEFESMAGVRVVLSPSEIQYLDFAAGNLAYLSELEPESVTWRPFIESRISDDVLEHRYAPRHDRAFDGGPLRILGESYEKGLALRSHTTLVFRVGSEFRRFLARVAMDDLARNSAVTSSVLFSVAGDDKVLWEGEIRSTDPPIDLDLEIMGVRRLKITVDFGEDLDIADFLDLADARFTK